MFVCIYIIYYLDFYPKQLIQNSRSDESREKIMQKAVPIFNNLLISDLFRSFTFVCVHTCQQVVFYCY